MAYFTIYDVSGNTNPLNFGTLNRDSLEVSSWVKATIKTDSGYVSTGNTTITVVDASGTDSSNNFQLAIDASGSPNIIGGYGDDLIVNSTINSSTGVSFWVRRKSLITETPIIDNTAVVRATGVVTLV